MNIPSNLDEAVTSLKEVLGNYYDSFVSETEDSLCSWHHDLGRWIRNNWNLWAGSELSKHFNSLGIHHPDDMSGIILTSAHRTWNQKPVELESQIQYYQDYWKNFNEKG